MRLGVLGNPDYPEIREVLGRLARKSSSLGAEVAFDRGSLEIIGDESARSLEESWDAIECLVTLGGDGTLLQGAREAGPRGVPVLGCNLGRLGFLTAVPMAQLEEALDRLAAGEYDEEERGALSVRRAGPEGEEGERFYALNDAVVHKSGFARLITLRVRADGEEVGQYSADGIVLSTATGSTGYSLSAGGPVLFPTMDAVVATPISPHMLAVRPVVLPADATLTVEVVTRAEETFLTVDGQVGVQLGEGDRVVAERSPHPVRLVRLPGDSFFSVLRKKLRWGDVRPRDPEDRRG